MTINDLKYTASLAHLNMSDPELAGVLKPFEETLAFLTSVQAAGEDRAAFPEGLPQSSQAALDGAFGNYRTINSASTGSAAVAGIEPEDDSVSTRNEKMLNNAGERDGRFLVVPNVL